MKRSKAYRAAQEKIKMQLVEPKAGIAQVKENAFAKFDETLEIHFNLGIDPRHSDQQLRGTINLPHGSGQKIKIVVIAPEAQQAAAKNAGADEVGENELIEKIQSGWTDFDLVIATPEVMGKVGKLGKLLGTRGLMPSPKSGTVTADLAKTVTEFKSGKIEYRNDKQGLIHMIFGKASFPLDQLAENFHAVYDAILKAKPSKSKGVYIKSIALCSAMGPSIRIETLKAKWKEEAK